MIMGNPNIFCDSCGIETHPSRIRIVKKNTGIESRCDRRFCKDKEG